MTKQKQLIKRPQSIRAMLCDVHATRRSGGDRLAVGKAKEVAAILLDHPKKAAEVVECLWDENAGVANRVADALERASYPNPKLLAPWKEALLGRMVDATENKLRWNLALMVSRMALNVAETERAAVMLRPWLDDRSSIVKTCAMHGLAGLTHSNPAMLPEVLDICCAF